MMRTSIVAATALAGGLLLVPLIQGPAQAGTPDLRNAVSASHDGAVTLVRGGGGGGGHGGGGGGGGHGGEGGGGHGGAMMAAGRMGGGGVHAYAGRGFDRGPRFAAREGREGGRAWHGEREGREGHRFVEREGREHHRFVEREGRERFDRDDFRHRRFFASNVFFYGYPYDYGGCYWLRRQAIITGSPYWWERYEACLGYY